MSETINPRAGEPAPADRLVDLHKLRDAYIDLRPDPAIAAQRIAFGTSGHRGVSLQHSFNEWHVLAISQAICDYRRARHIDGPLFLGIDTHALSVPARDSAIEVLAANGVEIMLSADDEYTPTPAISRAIVAYNHSRMQGLADGIVITPSHNPPEYGGFKYNLPNGGPAGTDVTHRIEADANAYLKNQLQGVARLPVETALRAATTHRHDYLTTYVDDLAQVIDMPLIRGAGLRMAVDPLGGAGVHYWDRIAERYGIDLTVTRTTIDPTFGFMTLDWDGEIRMDPSSIHAMQPLIGLKADYDIAFACDTDHDRHGIVTHAGLVPSNHYLCVMIDHLFRNRSLWVADAAIGKTAVSTALIDRVARRLGRDVYETPAGFKWFAQGLFDATLGFAGEESAGSAFARIDGTAWTADKDGITAALLAAEITAHSGRDPSELYDELAGELGEPFSARIEALASAEEKKRLANLSSRQIPGNTLAGDPIERVVDRAPGNDAPLGGIKVATAQGWFAARPSGTEDIYKIYAESLRGRSHLKRILDEARAVVTGALSGPLQA